MLLLVAAVIVGLDQLTKELALARLDDGPVDVIEGVLTLRLTYNPGGAFGLLRGVPDFFLFATVVVVGVILAWARNATLASVIPLGLVLGGGLGNLYDRLFRDTDGRVVDFIDLHVWPVFNLADSAIVVGVLALLLISLRADRSETADTATP